MPEKVKLRVMLKFPDAVHRHDWIILASIAAVTVTVATAYGFSMQNVSRFWFLLPAALTLIPASLAQARGQSRAQVTFITFFVWLFCASLVLGHGCYALTALNFPLQDKTFYAFDQAIGLDLVAFRVWVGESAWLSWALQFAYHNTGTQIMLGVIVLFFLRDEFKHLRDTVSVYMLGVLGTMVFMTLLPAIGAYPYLEMQNYPAGHLASAGTDGYVAHYMALRDGSMREFPVTGWKGIVTFPSFHTIISLVGVYAVSPIRWLFWPSALFSAVVMVSTLPVGGHYSIDVIGGVAIFLASVAYVKRRAAREAHVQAPVVALPAAGTAPA